MVSDSAPFKKNFFFISLKKGSQKSNLHNSCSFKNTFRLIDDLRDISDNGLFEKHFKEIYPEGLELKKGNLFSTKASFLDIDLKIKENKISTKLSDKRYSFPV